MYLILKLALVESLVDMISLKVQKSGFIEVLITDGEQKILR